MAVPVLREDLEAVLQPWLGTLFLHSNPLLDVVTAFLRSYAPYRQTLESLRDELESLLITRVNRYTNGSMMVLNDRYRTIRLTTEHMMCIS